MEVVYFTATAVLLYLVSDWILRSVESRLGRTLEYRTLLFFVILLALALTTFALIRRFAAA